jgi:hypothetical protein
LKGILSSYNVPTIYDPEGMKIDIYLEIEPSVPFISLNENIIIFNAKTDSDDDLT